MPLALAHVFRAVKHVKSNAITIAKDGRLLGMGSGQPNRVNSVRIALEKAAAEVQVRAPPLPPRVPCQELAGRWRLGAAAPRSPGMAARCMTQTCMAQPLDTPPAPPPLPAQRDRSWPATPSSRSRGTTAWSWHARLASRPSCTQAAACGTRTQSTAATSTALCSSPRPCATSGIRDMCNAVGWTAVWFCCCWRVARWSTAVGFMP